MVEEPLGWELVEVAGLYCAATIGIAIAAVAIWLIVWCCSYVRVPPRD